VQRNDQGLLILEASIEPGELRLSNFEVTIAGLDVVNGKQSSGAGPTRISTGSNGEVVIPDPVGKRVLTFESDLAGRRAFPFEGTGSLVWAARSGDFTFVSSASFAHVLNASGKGDEVPLGELGVDICCQDLTTDRDGDWVEEGLSRRQIMDSSGRLGGSTLRPAGVSAKYEGNGFTTIALSTSKASAAWRIAGVAPRRLFVGSDDSSVVLVATSAHESAPYTFMTVCRLRAGQPDVSCFKIASDAGNLPEGEPLAMFGNLLFVLDNPRGESVRLARYDLASP
jgi:hypothetical protein